MNKIYRLVWSQVSQAWVAVAENARGHGKSISARKLVAAAAALLGGSLLASSAYAANANDATVVGGQGSVKTAGNTTTITQGSQNLALDWTGLSTVAGEALVFVQPNAQAIALNRITGSSPSTLLGSLTANGQVYILNPNGVLFGAGAQVNVGGLVASTLTMDPADFMNGSRTFSKDPNATGTIENRGTLTAANGGYIALLGATVVNAGAIKTPLGSTLLAAGDKVTLNLNNGSLLGYTIDQGALQALVENKQLIQADGGQVWMAAKALDHLSTAVINNTGVIEAHTAQNQNGRIMLVADMDVGTVNAGGTLDASAPTGGDGGFIETSAANVNIADDIHVTTAAAQGKTGTWLIDPNDFRIAATGGNMSGAAVSANLANNNFQIQTATMGTPGGNGDITVDDAVTWNSANTLTLSAERNININRSITALNANGKLALEYGLGRANANNTATYNVDAAINLQAGQNFSTRLGSDGATVNYQVITALGDGAATGTDLRGVIADPNGHYVLGADIDAQSWSFGSPGNDALTLDNGVFDGLGHVISNLTGIGGLFSGINTGGVLRNLGLVNAHITNGQTYHAGMLVDINLGKIDNVYANGILTLVDNNLPPGAFNAGGLVGYNEGTITNSYTTGVVDGTLVKVANLGGLAGHNEGSISYSYSAANVTGGGSIGGLIGENAAQGQVNYAYATGDVSLIVDPAQISGFAGGLMGLDAGTPHFVYASGKVSASAARPAGLSRNIFALGALEGAGGFLQSPWDATTSGQTVSEGTSGFTDGYKMVGNAAYAHASYGPLGTWSETASGSGVWVATSSTGVKSWVMIEGSTRPFLYTEYATNIQNAHQLQLMALAPGAAYALNGNIDALATASGGSGMWSAQGFAPVGNSAAGFTGSFDGQGNQITDLFINRPSTDNVGLFGVSSGTIANVGLIDAKVTGGNNAGALAGQNNGTVIDAFVDGSVKGTSGVGGLVGVNSGSISDAYTYADTDVIGVNNVGGLVGSNSGSGVVDGSYAEGNVKATDTAGNAGGLAGNNDGALNDVYASGDVSGASAGGLAGRNGGAIVRAYASGDVTGSVNAGGLIGQNSGSGTASSVNAIGHVAASGAGAAAGGLIGANSGASGALSNGYWDSATSGQAAAVGSGAGNAVNISGNAVYQHATYANFGAWSETVSGSGVWVATDGNGTAWAMIEGSTRPFLYSEYSASISNAHQLQLMALNTGANYTLANDIDAGATRGGGSSMWSTQGFAAVGNSTSAYTGVFDGQDNVVNNLIINRAGTDNVGLFGITSGVVRHVGLDGGSVTGGNAVGGLIGRNSGVVSDVFTTGNITGAGTVGGIVGVNETGGAIDNAHVEGQVTATGSGAVAGGLVGQNDGAISLAYSVGTVGSQNTAGGLVGTNNGSVDTTYASGKTVGGSVAGGLIGVNNGSVASSYWDTVATGVAVGAGSGSAGGMTNIDDRIPSGPNPPSQQIAANPAFGIYAGLGTWSQPGNGGSVVYATDSSGNKTWVMMPGSTRPFLYSEYTTTIRNAHQLQLMMVDPGANYTLANNIDASLTNGSNIGNMWNTLGFMPIGTGSDFSVTPFTGNFNGRNYVISNLVVNRTGMQLNAGLFGVVYGGDIRNIGMEGGSIASNGSAGGLIGSIALGSVSNAYATGTVFSQFNWAGGLIGSGTGTIDNVYATGDVSGNIAGGLIGYNGSGLSNAYASGDVRGPTAGGLIGQNAGNVADAYATGSVVGDLSNGATSTVVGGLIGQFSGGSVSSSFWNTQTSGVGVGVGSGTAGGISGIDNTAASQLATYTNAGWDIDAVGGTGSAWRIYEGQTGPLLRSFLKAVTVTGTAIGKTYDGRTDTASAYNTNNGASLDGILAYVTSRNAGSYSTAGGTLKQTGLYSNQQGYDISYNDASLTIAKASVTLSNTDASKTYDGTSAASSGMITAAGQLFGSDTVSASGYAYGDKNAGGGKTVTASGVAVDDGNGGNNYNVSYVANTNSSIARADVTLGTADITKTYDGTTAAPGAISVLSGTVFGGDSISGGNVAFTDKNAGVGNKTVAVVGAMVGDGVNNANYNVTYANNTTSTINKADLIVTAQQESKTYDGTTNAAGSGIAGALAGAGAGEVVDNAGMQAFLDKNAGSGDKTVVASGVTVKDAGNADTSGNYNIVYVANSTSTIDKAALTVGASGIDRVYDGMTDAAVAFNDNRIAGDQLDITGNAAFVDKNAGSNVAVNVGGIALSGADSGNYQLANTSAATTADITQASATVTANSVEKFYDGQAYAGGAGLTVSGLVGGDTVADLGVLNYGGPALGASGVGNYAITPGGAGNGNYRLSFVDGQLTIKAVNQPTPVLSQASAALGGAAMEQAYNAAQQGVFGGIGAGNPSDGAGGQKSSDQRSDVLTVASSGKGGVGNVPDGGGGGGAGGAAPVQQITPRLSFSGCGMSAPDGSGC